MVPVRWCVKVTDIELMRFSVMVIKYATFVFYQEKQYLHDWYGVRRTGRNEY
jgi:hypothetical protein